MHVHAWGDCMCLPTFPAPAAACRSNPPSLNGVYGRLLEALFVEATSNSQAAAPGQDQPGTEKQAGGDGGSGAPADGSPGVLDLSRCKLVAAEWQRQARSCNASPQPQTALVFEAFAVVRMLGQQEFSGEEGTAVALARQYCHCQKLCVQGAACMLGGS